MKIRVVKTASDAKAVQAVKYQDNKRIVVRHFGSCHGDDELKELLAVAHEWVREFAGQLSIFPDQNPGSILHLNHCTFLGVYYTFFYDLIAIIQQQLGFGNLQPLLKDLVTLRIFEPASKLRSIELLENYFGIVRQRKNFYKIAPKWLGLKEEIEASVVAFARDKYAFEFDLVFYDVTTLYFEAFEEDELRRNGFSKDNKSQQPQILVALMVSKEGFPLGYEVFSGNTFEGHTIIPAIKAFVNKHHVQTLTVVADAAMISATNVQALIQQQLNYIVGARLGNLSNDLIAQVDESLVREDGRSIRLSTDNGYLICSYSSTRHRKDKYEMEKQIEKAKSIVATPSKNRKLKFTKAEGQGVELNEKLIAKTQKLLGIKGYYTNLAESVADNQTIIKRYHELYKVENAFRISKSDLETRPIFHFKEEPIKLHMLICFMALTISRHIELSTGHSIAKFITECKKVTDARILNHITNKEIRLRANITPAASNYQLKLNAPH